MDPRQSGAGIGYSHKTLMDKMSEAKARAENLNLCPFGCETEQLDEHGYCRHLVGFSNDGKTFEPRENHPDHWIRSYVNGKNKQPVMKGDQIVEITTSSRVYRKNVPEPEEVKESA